MKKDNIENAFYSVFVNRMIMRNKSIKWGLILGIVMAWLLYIGVAFLFFWLDMAEDKISNLYVNIQLIFNGISTFCITFFAYLSSFHADLESKRIDLKKLITVTYKKSLLFNSIVYLLPILVFYGKSKVFFLLLESALFHMGLGAFLSLSISAHTTQYMTIHARNVDEVKFKNSINGYFIIPWLTLGLILVVEWLLIKVTSPLIGHSVVLIIELAFILTFRLWINVVLKIFKKNRYKKMELYLSM